MPMLTPLRARFLQQTGEVKDWDVLVVAVRMPNGCIETIVNHKPNVQYKVRYYRETYDEQFRLHHNKMIQIVGYMLV